MAPRPVRGEVVKVFVSVVKIQLIRKLNKRTVKSFSKQFLNSRRCFAHLFLRWGNALCLFHFPVRYEFFVAFFWQIHEFDDLKSIRHFDLMRSGPHFIVEFSAANFAPLDGRFVADEMGVFGEAFLYDEPHTLWTDYCIR